MTSLKGDLRSIMGTPFGGVGHAVLIFSRVTRAAFNSDSVVLQLHDRIEMPEEADGKFQVDGLDPGPIRIELEGGTVHNHGWNIDLPDEGVWSLTDLVDAQVDWSPAVIGRAEAAAREARDHADRAEAGADRVGTAEQVGTWASEASDSASAAASARSGAVTARDAAQSARDAAEGHADRAATSESNAKTSETNAKQSETNAGDFAAVATTAATEAVNAMESASDAASSIGDSVSAAAGHADRASQSESGAAAYAQNASDAADRVGTAEQVGTWAQQAQDAADRVGTAEQVGVWADESSAAASLASTSASKAKVSETNAATHEANSLSAAERAEFAATETIQQVEGDFATRNYVDQRVPVGLLTGKGSPAGRVTAPMGAIYTDSDATNGAIRWIKTSNLPTTGWQVEYGDTGWRDVTGLLTNGWTANQVLLRRQNNTVMLSTLGLSAQTATSGVFISLPGTFHTPKTFVTIVTPGSSRSAYWNLSQGLTMWSYSGLEINTYANAQSTWQLEANRAWPTTLPGTPV